MRETLEEMAAAVRGPHLEPDEIAAYHAGELSPEDEKRVQGHLAACRECAELLLDLDGLGDPGFGAEEDLPAGAEEKVWEGLRTQVQTTAGTRAVVETPRRGVSTEGAAVRPFPVERRRLSTPPRWLQALAASLLIAVVGLSLWVATLRRTVDELSQPQLDAPVLDLYSTRSRGEAGAPPVFTVPGNARWFTVILNPSIQRMDNEYRVEIVESGGETVWSGSGLHPNIHGSLSLTLSRRLLGAGDFRIRLIGRDPSGGGQGEQIEEYVLRVEP